MAFDPKSDYAGKSSTPGKAGGYSGGVSGGKSYGGGQGIAAAKNLPSPARIMGGALPTGAPGGLMQGFGSGMSAKDFYGALRGPGPAQMGMPTSSGPGGIMGKILPSGDSIGAGFGAMMPSPMRALSSIGEKMGGWTADAMRAYPDNVMNVGGKPMSMQPWEGAVMGMSGRSTAPLAFNGLYGNKDPQALNSMDFMQNAKRGAYAPWRGDIPYFGDRGGRPNPFSAGLY